MDKASDFGSEDCRFESCHGHTELSATSGISVSTGRELLFCLRGILYLALNQNCTATQSCDLTLNDVDFYLRRLDEVGAGVAGVDAAVLRPRPLQDERADGRGRLVGQHAHPATGRGVVDWLKKLGTFWDNKF